MPERGEDGAELAVQVLVPRRPEDERPRQGGKAGLQRLDERDGRGDIMRAVIGVISQREFEGSRTRK